MTGRVIGLFAGPGGVDMGARILGIEGTRLIVTARIELPTNTERTTSA